MIESELPNELDEPITATELAERTERFIRDFNAGKFASVYEYNGRPFVVDPRPIAIKNEPSAVAKIGDTINVRKPRSLEEKSGLVIGKMHPDFRPLEPFLADELLYRREATKLVKDLMERNLGWIPAKAEPAPLIVRVRSWFRSTFTIEIGNEYECFRFIKIWRFHFLIRET